MMSKQKIIIMLIALSFAYLVQQKNGFLSTGLKDQIGTNLSSKLVTNNTQAPGIPLQKGTQKMAMDRSPASAAAESRVEDSLEFRSLSDALERFEKCRQSQDCEQDETDSRSGEMSLLVPLKKSLSSFTQMVQTQKWKSEKVYQLALALMRIEDGEIRQRALEIIHLQDPRPESVAPVITGVLKYHDGELVEIAVNELERHLQGPAAEFIHENIKECLLSGSYLVREKLVPQMDHFINRSSLEFYRRMVSEPRLDAVSKKKLQAVLREWSKNQIGG